MIDAGDRAYVYAKACGILSKSFVGKRLYSLTRLHTLSEFDRTVFPDSHRELPGNELLADLERRIEARAVSQILSIIKHYRKPPRLLVLQLRAYEYGSLKTCLHYITSGGKKKPQLCDIGKYGTINFGAFPDLQAMLKDSGLNYLLSGDRKIQNLNGEDLTALEIDLDRHYYNEIIKSLNTLSDEDSQIARVILAEEISLRNCVWAFRLRRYFNKNSLQTAKYLLKIKMKADPDEKKITLGQTSDFSKKEIALESEAAQSLEKPLDSRAPWHGWRWEKFLNPEKTEDNWIVDPRFFQNASSQYLYRLAQRCIHHMPMAISTAFCFIKLKQYEESILTSIAEGLGLGMDNNDVFRLLEVPA
jgi:vacuolar-type H+-ATPase subunit C/Vma6